MMDAINKINECIMINDIIINEWFVVNDIIIYERFMLSLMKDF